MMNEKLRSLVAAGVVKRWGGKDGKLLVPQANIDYEIATIERFGWSDYFVMAAEMVDAARKAGGRIGPGRGAVGASVVAYALGITNINRMNELVQIQQQIYLVNGERVMFDDDLAKKSGAFETLKELKEDIRKNLEAQANHEAEEKYKDDLLNELVDESKTEAPASLVDEQCGRIKEDMLRNLESRGFTIEDYLKKNNQKQEDWEREVRENAERRVMSSIIVQRLSDELKVEVSDEDLNKQVVEMQHVYKNDKSATEQLQDPQVINSIRNRMRINKTMDKLVELNRPHAKVVKKPAFAKEEKPAKKAAKKAPAKKAKK